MGMGCGFCYEVMTIFVKAVSAIAFLCFCATYAITLPSTDLCTHGR